MQDMWEKFVQLGLVAGISCLMRASFGDILAAPSGREAMFQIFGEEHILGDMVARAHQLDDRLRDVIRTFSASAEKRRGRPSNCMGREDFALEEVDAGYHALLQKHEGEAQRRRLLAAAEGTVLASAERTPSELAYTEILQDMTADFPNICWTALRNKHSAWNSGHFHPAENHIDSDDYDAEIERRFPAPPKS